MELCKRSHDVLKNKHAPGECETWVECPADAYGQDYSDVQFDDTQTSYEYGCQWLMICGAERVPKLYAALEKLEKKRK